MKPVEKLFTMIPQLDAIEFTGLARLMGVQLLEETNPEADVIKDRFSSRDFISVLNEILERFDKLNRTRKRESLSIVKDATKRARGPRLAGRMEDLVHEKDTRAPNTESD